MNKENFLFYVKETLAIEIAEAQNMLNNLDDDNIILACQILFSCTGKVVISGMGKSGHIGKKIAASLASTGTPAFFVHPAEALHGDLGMISAQDVVVFISYSGCARELNILLPLLVENGIKIIALTGRISSPLALLATCVLNINVKKEACPIGLVPTSSAVNTLMMGDALTIALMRYRGFSLEQFARSHPGGNIGAKLLNRVHSVMRSGDRIPRILQKGTVMEAMFELSRTGLGLTAICDDFGKVSGVFTDGDLRRWLVNGNLLTDSITQAMTIPGYQLSTDCRVCTAIEILHQHQITAAPVVNSCGILVGAINVHDLYQANII